MLIDHPVLGWGGGGKGTGVVQGRQWKNEDIIKISEFNHQSKKKVKKQKQNKVKT